LGIIAGGGILLCALATFVALPALIALGDDGVAAESLPRPFRNSWLRIGTSKFPVTAAIVSGAVIVGVTACAFRLEDKKPVPVVEFDHNLLNLQAEGLESVEVLRRLFEDANESLLYAVSVADSPEEALALKAKFEALPTVAEVKELASRLPQASPEETRRLVQQVRSRLAGLPAAAPAYEPPSPASVGRSIERLYQVVRRIDDVSARRLTEKLNGFLDALEKLPFAEQRALLARYQQAMAQSLLMQFQVMAMASDPEPLTAADLPPELTSRFIRLDGPRQKWLLQVYPKEQVWDFEPLSRFVADLRSVDPDVTGTPLQNYEASRQIKKSYETAALYALVVICLVLMLDFLERENKLLVLVPPLVVIAFTAMTLSTRGVPVRPMYLVLGYLGMTVAMAAVLDFRNLRDAALTLVPPFAAGAMTVGVLALLGQSFNAANLIVLPLILGIGVDNGVYVVHNYRSQRGKQFTLDASTANAMLITSLTNIIGFGSLMIAAHRGLFGVGLVLSVGVACTLFVSLTTLPAILSWLTKEPRAKAAKKGRDLEEEELEAATRPDNRHKHQQQRRAA
ncbi:MAG TPA: MMPL family transporter, partial [Planctomycetaceae bacterium]